MSPYFLSTSRRLPTSRGSSWSFTPSRREYSATWKIAYHPWAKMITLSRFCWMSCRRQRCLQAVRRGKCKHRPGEEHVHLDGAFGLLGGMFQVPRLLTFLDAAVLDETPIVIGVEGCEGLVDCLFAQQYHLPARAIVPIVPLPDDHGLERVLREVLAVPLPRVLGGPIL